MSETNKETEETKETKETKEIRKIRKVKITVKPKKAIKSAEKVVSVRMRVICVDPLEPKKYDARFGIQDENRFEHKGKKVQKGDIYYDIEVRAKYDAETKKPLFFSPWTNGTPDERFLYLAWTPIDPNSGEAVWFRRMKISLSSISWKQVEEASRMQHGVLEVSVAGKEKDGSPACASVPLLGKGWVVRKIRSYKPIQPSGIKRN